MKYNRYTVCTWFLSSTVHALCFLRQRQGLLRWRPTVGLPPAALPLSGVLFSQSLMRPATPVFITAASCLDRVKGQLSLFVIGNEAEQEVAVHWALSSLSLSLCSSHSQSFINSAPTPRLLPWTGFPRFQVCRTRCPSPTCSWCSGCCRSPWGDPRLRSEGTPCSLSAGTEKWDYIGGNQGCLCWSSCLFLFKQTHKSLTLMQLRDLE